MTDLRIFLLSLVFSLWGCMLAQTDDSTTNPLVSQDTVTPQDLFMIAEEWMEDGQIEKCIELLRYLASDLVGYAVAMAKLGQLFLEQNEYDAALRWFLKAGKHKHPYSLYSAGKLLLKHKKDTIGALSHLQRAAILWDESDPEKTVVREDWEDLCRSIPQFQLSLDQRRDAFEYGSLTQAPSDVDRMWVRVIGIVAIKAGSLDRQALVDSALELEKMLSNERMTFSPLQRFLMLDFMVDLAVPISKVDKTYLPVAATYAEQLQYDPYCLYCYNESKTEPGCFNTITETALLAYRALEDEESVQRVTARAESIQKLHVSL